MIESVPFLINVHDLEKPATFSDKLIVAYLVKFFS